MADNELVIEEAQMCDAPAIKMFLDEVSQETSFIINDGQDISVEDLQNALSFSLNSLNRICLLAKVNDNIIGMVNVTSSDEFNFNHVGDLFIAVKQAYSGHGVGHYLMELVCDWAEHSPQIKRLELSVQTRNTRAIKLYQDFGFEIEGEKKAALKLDEDTYLNLLMMSKLIGNIK
ncbi:GNAT family N-acetyltransferase [Streptococcus thoraltensis]|uniref:GNAT family N-acetyltransferase n=1 Tax=Streptococcus thoraltensis TaxID=55085 RepID=UPI000366C441|nr:GNAT family N-acetyltransferase [Streptococcus thoraltensis]MDY4761366.1 GNAT family N-acetyltransferase [Streptococcus thoraltensis]